MREDVEDPLKIPLAVPMPLAGPIRERYDMVELLRVARRELVPRDRALPALTQQDAELNGFWRRP